MTSAVAICNLGLAHLGQETQISSISPTDGSRESGYCAMFYPIARQELIELVPWTFATKRIALAEVTNLSTVWAYAYALPSDCLKPVRVLTLGDFSSIFLRADRVDSYPGTSDDLFDEGNSANFQVEGEVIYTHEPAAVLIYRFDETNTGRFTPLFSTALGMMMASYLAGPIIRGTEGAKTSAAWRDNAELTIRRAAFSDANSSSQRNDPTPEHIAGRG
jgi:hypothetical protein